MLEQYNSICITKVASSILNIMGLDIPECMDSPIDILAKLSDYKLNKEKADRVVIYNPDAVAMWLYQKYTHMFEKAICCSDVSLPMLSVMPSVTPVCFASMYSGVLPQIHGINTYIKPVLRVNTVFDTLLKAQKRVALVSTTNDSISMIFLERQMDYFIYDSVEEVNSKAIELIEKDEHDVIVIYNGNYDTTMHKHGTQAEASLEALKNNIDFYQKIVDKIKKCWSNHNTFYGFAPDHGCHDIDGNCGSHGLDMVEDMNVVHFYGFNSRTKFL